MNLALFKTFQFLQNSNVARDANSLWEKKRWEVDLYNIGDYNFFQFIYFFFINHDKA
jgi:hypothetical protein